MEQDAVAGLPPFSFSKKPIRSPLHSLVIPSNFPSRQRSKEPPLAAQPTFNNINYDEQIRAPRMSLNATNYTYKPDRPTPFTGKSFSSVHLETTEEDDVCPTVSQPSDKKPSTPENTYHPATADINQPTRRYLGPVKPAWKHESNRILSPGLSERRESGSASEEEREKLLRAMANLNNNVTSDEKRVGKHESLESLQTELRLPTSDRNRKGEPAGREPLKQVYNMKKPVCLPAVLRPINGETHLHEEDFHYDLSPELRLPNLKLEENPFDLMVSPSNEERQKTRPTRDHWRPDNLSDHCMNCFETFATFFYPQGKWRHHCRFCGLLFCYNCLHKSREMSFEIPQEKEKSWPRANSGSSNGGSVKSATSVVSLDELESGIMLDAKARLVVPMFKNLVDQNITIGELQNKFHSCKICKLCGSNFQRLLYLFNQRSRNEGNIDAPYVFIENPYTKAMEAGQTNVRFNRLIEASAYDQQRRHSSLTNNVPSDWTWSSF